MTAQHSEQPAPLASLLSYAERESAGRAKGTPAGTTRLQDDELAALMEVLRREVGTVLETAGPG